MVIIEASNINVGGSFNLLKDLAAYCCKTHRETIIYVMYETVYKGLEGMKLQGIVLKKTTKWKTLVRYLTPNRKNVLYFCSLPPLVTNQNAFLYFHTEYYATHIFENIVELSWGERVKKIIYYPWIKIGLKYCSGVYCQTEHIGRKLKYTYGVQPEIKPFFKSIEIPADRLKQQRRYDFIYPALASKHKNHQLLFSAFIELRKTHHFTAIVTIPTSAVELIEQINKINNLYPGTIFNWGILNHDKIIDLLLQSKWLVFPSLMESLGIPLLEAISCGTKVVASDMEYVKSGINNPVLFDPTNKDCLVEKLQNVLDGKYDTIEQSIKLLDSKEYILRKFE